MAAHSSYHEAQQLLDEEIADLTARMQQAIRMLKARRTCVQHHLDNPGVSAIQQSVLNNTQIIWEC